MTWVQATVVTACGSCGSPVPITGPVLLVTQARLPRCASCAKAIFNAEPPCAWPVPEVVVVTPKPMEFLTPKGWAVQRKAALAARVDFDPRMARAGGDE